MGFYSAQRSLKHAPQRQRLVRSALPAPRPALNEVWGMNPRDSSPGTTGVAGRWSTLNEVWGMNPRDSWPRFSAPTARPWALNEVWGMNPRDSRACITSRLISLFAQRSLGHEPQRQSSGRSRSAPCAATLNEVWGMNPRDRFRCRTGWPGAPALNEVWGMNPRDSAADRRNLELHAVRSTKSGA